MWDEDLVARGDLYYKKFTHVPFTGTVTGKRRQAKEGETGRSLGDLPGQRAMIL